MEFRDLYDENRNLTGEKIKNTDPVPHGRYYVTVMVFIENSKGEMLLQKRSQEKGGQWATTGGHPKSGESSEQGIRTEILEELGIDASNDKLIRFKTIKTEDDFVDLYYLRKDINLSDIVLQEEEVDDVGWFSKGDLNTMISNGQFFKHHVDPYLDFLEYVGKDYSKRQDF